MLAVFNIKKEKYNSSGSFWVVVSIPLPDWPSTAGRSVNNTPICVFLCTHGGGPGEIRNIGGRSCDCYDIAAVRDVLVGAVWKTTHGEGDTMSAHACGRRYGHAVGRHDLVGRARPYGFCRQQAGEEVPLVFGSGKNSLNCSRLPRVGQSTPTYR